MENPMEKDVYIILMMRIFQVILDSLIIVKFKDMVQ